MSLLDDKRVAVVRPGATYPRMPPYHPSEAYPEYPFGSYLSSEPNPVYRAVREAFLEMGLDRERFGTQTWNPLGTLIRPGARVVVKPNWVLHRNQADGGTDCLVTHPAVLRAVLDYVFLARPDVVIVGDAPVQGCDWQALMALGFEQVVDFQRAHGLNVSAKDFRRTVLRETRDLKEVQTDLRPLSEYIEVDLGTNSLLEPISASARRFRVTMYDPRKMWQNHGPGRHRYLVARDVLAADVVINLPKLKTHKKAGITAALKNLVGINGNKDYLPHHRKGPPCLGGDNYEKFSFLKWLAEQVLDIGNMFFLKRPYAYRWFNRVVYYLLVADQRLGGSGDVEGSWYGNDTVWRMCLDLNRLLIYADREGQMQERPQRQLINIADGVVAGQGEGPLKPDPLNLGVVLASVNPGAMDWVAAHLMRINPAKIPIIRHAFDSFVWPLSRFTPDAIECVHGGKRITDEELAKWARPARPPRGWAGFCEL